LQKLGRKYREAASRQQGGMGDEKVVQSEAYGALMEAKVVP